MALYLLESSLKEVVSTKEELDQKVSALQSKLKENNSALIEVQVSKDFSRSFFIVEAKNKMQRLKHLKLLEFQ